MVSDAYKTYQLSFTYINEQLEVQKRLDEFLFKRLQTVKQGAPSPSVQTKTQEYNVEIYQH